LIRGGDLLYGVFGYSAEQTDAPAWVELIVGAVALVLFLVPCAGAVFYGWLANRAHDRRGLIPLVIGGIVGTWMTVVSVITVVSAMLD
jgi:MFS family permease